MKNHVFRYVCLCLACLLLYTVPAYASEEEDWEVPVTQHSELLPRSVKIAKSSTIQPRGRYFSAAVVQISNPEPGVIGISGNTACSQKVDEIYMKLYLDVKKDGDWRQVDSWAFYTYNEVANFHYLEVTDFEPGYYYRLRGSHAVYMGNVKETKSSYTDGIYCE